MDKALIRTGRIDIKIHFKKCSKQIYKEIIDHFYETNCDTNHLNDGTMSPSDVIELCFNNTCAKDVIDIIAKL